MSHIIQTAFAFNTLTTFADNTGLLLVMKYFYSMVLILWLK